MSITVYSKERGLRRLIPGATLKSYKAKYPSAIRVKIPSIKTLEKYSYEGIAKTPCGCRVEPDGECSHGNPSWLIVMGLI